MVGIEGAKARRLEGLRQRIEGLGGAVPDKVIVEIVEAFAKGLRGLGPHHGVETIRCDN